MMVNFMIQVRERLAWVIVVSNQIDKALRQYINYLPVSPMCFNGTILDNLLLGAREG